MTTYRITAPNGKTYEIEGPPGASQAEVIQAVLAQSPEAGVAPPETTFLGQAKEAFKGLIPGAVGLVEQAAIGASALLPEEQERAAREAIASTAGALKAPFAPAPGYEDSVVRKISEAVGSTGPFLAAGPLGLAGRLGAIGLGVGAGAGEARTRAEAEGATAEQRGTATALGTLPGALEVFAPFRILSRIPEGEVLNAAARVRRVLTAAGEEAAQEAASGLAQNMIARGVYKPEQELIEGLGEQAAYGGATGAIVQGLMDLALGRRARGAGAAPEVEGEAPIDRLKREAAEKAQAPETAQVPEAAQAEEAPAEPTVRKPAGPKPLPEVLDSETVKTIGFVRGRIHDALVGKSIADPEVRAILEEYKQRKPSRKTVDKIDAFLGRLPETVPAPPVPEAPTAPEVVPPTTPAVEAERAPPVPETPTEPTTPETPSDTTTEPATGGAGVPVATEPAAVSTPAGAGVVEPTGVVPPAEDAGQPVVGEGAEPSAVAEAPSAFGAMARDVEKVKPTYSKADEDILLSQLREVKADIKALKTAQKNLRTPQGAVLEEDREAFDEAQGQIDQLAEQQKVLDNQLIALRRTKPKKEEAVPVKRADLGINYFADPSEQVADLEREIDQAVGAYNNPRSDTKRRQVSTDYLFRLAKDATVPEGIRTRAKEALAFAVDPRDLRDNQRDDYTALTKNVKDTGKEWEAMRFTKLSKGFYTESEPEELQRLEQALTGKSLVEVADYMAGYFKVGDQKLIAKRVAERIKSLQAAGYDFDFKIVNTGDPAPTIIASGAARGIAHLTYPNNKPKSTVYLRGAGMDSTGMHPRIILHELVHAAAVGAMNVGKLPGAKGSAPAKIYNDLRTVFNAFIDHYNKRATAYRSGRGQLNEVELAIYKGEVNAANDPDELLAWGLTSPKFQEYLESIPYKGRNLWTQFVDSIRGFLGLAPRTDTVLSEVLHVADDILTSDPKNELSLIATLGAPSAQAPAIARKELVGEPEKATAGDYLGRTLGDRKTIGLRVQTTDSLAGVEAELGEAYAERVSDMLGNKNPVVLLSRALDSQRFAAEMLNVGTMVVDPSGMTRLTELDYNGQNISYASVMRDVAAEAKRRGLSGEAFVKQFGEVLAGRREYELMQDPDSKDLDFFLTPQEAQAANDRFNNDAFIKDAAAKLDAIRFAGIDLLVATERITTDKAKEWKDATAYTPFKRIDEMDKEAIAQGQGGVSSDLKLAAFRNMKEFKGSKERQTINPLENFVDLMEWMVRESMKNEAVRRALGDMDLIGAAKKVPNPQDVPNNQKGALVPVYEKGQQKFYLVPDPANLAAFTGFKAGSTIFPVRAMQKFSQVLRVGVTATPPFAVKQVFDDITRLYVHSGVKNPAALIPRMLLNFPKAWWAEVRGLRTPGMEMLARHGVVPTYDTIEGGNVRNVFEETGISKRSVGKVIMRIMEAGAKASDISARQAIFDQTIKETGDVDLAEQRAREIINFSRKGASATADTLIRIVPFFNAYARSMDKLLLAAAGNPAMQKTLGMSTGYARNLFFKRMGILTAMGLSYALLMSDDEEYQALSDNVRDRNWVLPYGEELGFTPVIPLPGELAFFFKAIPERVVQYYKLQGTPEERDALRVAKEMMLAGIDLFWAPNLTPQMVKPFVENLANYSFFLGRPLESQAQQQLDPSKRFGTGTSEAVKAGAEALSEAGIELSPIKIENAIRGVFGMSAGIALSVADALVNPTRTDRPLHQQIIPQLTGASALMKDPVGNRFLDDIYDFEKDVERAYNTYNKLAKDEPEQADAYYMKTFGLQSVREEMKDIMNAVRELNKQAREIDKMTDIPSEERAQLMAELKSQQNELARASYTLRRRAALAQMEVGG